MSRPKSDGISKVSSERDSHRRHEKHRMEGMGIEDDAAVERA